MSRPFALILGLLLACGLNGTAFAQPAHRHDVHDPTHADANQPMADATPPAAAGAATCPPVHAALGHCTPAASEVPADAHDAHDVHRHNASPGQPQMHGPGHEHGHMHGQGHANQATPAPPAAATGCTPQHATMGHCTPAASAAPAAAHGAHGPGAAPAQQQPKHGPGHEHAHGQGHADHATPAPPAAATGCTPQHAAMGHCTPAASAVPAAGHAAHGPGAAPGQQQTHGHGHEHAHGQEHADQATPAPPAAAAGCTPQHAAMGHCAPSPASAPGPREPIPAVTEDDRKAAFPVLTHGHEAHGATAYTRVKFNRFEAWDSDSASGQAWEGSASVGGDIHRLWLRSSGSRSAGHTTAANAELRWSRAVARWWDVVAGVRHDAEPGPSRTRGAVGIQGIAPYQFEVSALAYFGDGGLAARFEAEYDMRFTNRLILQPLLEVELHAQDDPARGIGSGLSKAEAGLRLRYEITRRFAPYVGVAHERTFGRTARFHEAEGEDSRETRLVAGVRFWF